MEKKIFETVPDILSYWNNCTPNNSSILAEDKDNADYRQLFSQVNYTVNHLNEMGVGRNDKVATVLNNGPYMATAFLGIASCSSCAPLNPAYTFKEYEFYIQDLRPKALIMEDGTNEEAIKVAEKYNVPVLFLNSATSDIAGSFTLSEPKDKHKNEIKKGYAEPEDVALILHTSGTTSRPKMVPLTHTNICTSAYNISNTLMLEQEDRCLNIMPLFHIHGLIGATLSTIASGASIVCTQSFIATKFYEWLEFFNPTWYTAVPTMHQLILARSESNIEIIKGSKLRFIRSSSSALPPTLMNELEQTFKVPVIESYGMTEASHQMASNPLPPLPRKSGTVGRPAGPQITILDKMGMNYHREV